MIIRLESVHLDMLSQSRSMVDPISICGTIYAQRIQLLRDTKGAFQTSNPIMAYLHHISADNLFLDF